MCYVHSLWKNTKWDKLSFILKRIPYYFQTSKCPSESLENQGPILLYGSFHIPGNNALSVIWPACCFLFTMSCESTIIKVADQHMTLVRFKGLQWHWSKLIKIYCSIKFKATKYWFFFFLLTFGIEKTHWRSIIAYNVWVSLINLKGTIWIYYSKECNLK